MKILVIGYFANNDLSAGGQSTKTILLYEKLSEIYGKDSITKIETANWQKNIFAFLIKILKSLKEVENVIILPAQNGVKVLAPLLYVFKYLFGYRLFYVVIGGWLPDLLKKNKWLITVLKGFNCIFPETQKLIELLKRMGILNLKLLRNFKDASPIYYCRDNDNSEFKICTMSRVTPMKGILDAISVIKKIKSDGYEVILDIYGPIEDGFEEAFYSKLNRLPKVIKYCGKVNYYNASSAIANYDLLLFPTYYMTEGIPGTIIDAYCAGVPVVAYCWISGQEVIKDGITGLLVNQGNIDGLYRAITNLINKKNLLMKMKKNCKTEYQLYKSDIAIKTLLEELEYK